MPSYKTHSIHSELVSNMMDKYIIIDSEAMKTYAMGPDVFVVTEKKLFTDQHRTNVKKYFETLIRYIKERKLYENSEVMAFLYGQLDHFVLDATTHPYIYYITTDIKSDNKLNGHALIEMWIDEYYMDAYDKSKKRYYTRNRIIDSDLNKLVDDVYKEVFGLDNVSKKLSKCIWQFKTLDSCVRSNTILIAPPLIKAFNAGDIKYRKDLDRAKSYMNFEHEEWLNPETGEKSNKSFDEMFEESVHTSLEIIKEINDYMYFDKDFNHPLIDNDTCYNTGLPCEKGQTLKYVKKYKKGN